MSPTIGKMLYATDLSQNSAYAFRYAIYLARKLDAKIVVLHVMEKMSPDAQLVIQTYIDAKDQENIFANKLQRSMERIEKRLHLFCEKELENAQEVKERIDSIEVCQGYPAEEILLKTESLQCDAVIMGAHEKGITHTFLGSVAKSVLRRSRRPTFIFPLPKGDIDLSVRDE